MKKVLITGGSGFIGKNLSAYLKKDGLDVLEPDSNELNVLRLNDMDKWENMNIDHIVHLAGKTFVPDSWQKPEEFFAVNTYGMSNIIYLCRHLGVKMTYISAYIYGQPKSNPVSETAEVNPNNPYAESKFIAEELCRFFCKYFDMDITILRLFNVFGPGQKEHFLIPSIIKQVLNEGNIISVQDLNPKRDYIYIDDVCKAVEMSINNTKGYQLYNIGSGESYSVGEVVETVQKIAGTAKKIVAKNNIRRNELNDVVADIRLIKREWGWKPEITFEKGLAKCMEVKNE